MPGKRKRALEEESTDEEISEETQRRDRRKPCLFKDSSFLREERFMAEMKNSKHCKNTLWMVIKFSNFNLQRGFK